VKHVSTIWREIIRDSAKLSSTDKLVGFLLSTYMDKSGEAFPSRETIAAGCSLSDRAVDAAASRLEVAGFLQVIKNTNPQGWKGGRGQVNHYVALLPGTANDVHRSEWERAKDVRPSKGLNGERRALNGEPDDINGERRSPEQGLTDKKNTGALAEAARLIEDVCGGCGKKRSLPDDIYCSECLAKRVVAT
jgi:hypothetical protein